VTKATVEWAVTGLHCGGCEQRAYRAVARVPGVMEAAADHRTGMVRVVFDSDAVDPAVVANRLAAAGFPPVKESESQ
jgi:copper chaperone